MLPPVLRMVDPSLEPLNFSYVSPPMGPTESPTDDMEPLMLPLPALGLAPLNVMQSGDINEELPLEVLGIAFLDVCDLDCTNTSR